MVITKTADNYKMGLLINKNKIAKYIVGNPAKLDIPLVYNNNNNNNNNIGRPG